MIFTLSSLPTKQLSSRKVLKRSGQNAKNRPKRFKKDHPADGRNVGHEQGNLPHSGPLSILKNPLN